MGQLKEWNEYVALFIIPIACIMGALYTVYCWFNVSNVEVDPHKIPSPSKRRKSSEIELQKNSVSHQNNQSSADTDDYDLDSKPTDEEAKNETSAIMVSKDKTAEEKVFEIYNLIRDGAKSFLMAEYFYLLIYIITFGVILLVVIGVSTKDWTSAPLTMLSFFAGAGTSVLAGYIGMMIATYANARTTLKARESLHLAFQVAFDAGQVMSFSLVTLGITTIFLFFSAYYQFWFIKGVNDKDDNDAADFLETVCRSIAGFGIGASSVALFARVGGGIYTKAADVGADLVGKVEANIPEDDPRNPATIADNVGDNVGDIAGMGADLFGSFAGSTCASFVLSSQLEGIASEQKMLPLLFGLGISAIGMISCLLSSVITRVFMKIESKKHLTSRLRIHELLSAVISGALIFLYSYLCFSTDNYDFPQQNAKVKMNWYKAASCAVLGLVSGTIIGFITEYFTSDSHKPVQDLAAQCRTGAATNIIAGLSLGYNSTAPVIIIIAIDLFISMIVGHYLGVVYCTIGTLVTLTATLASDAYGPVADNAGGIAEMALSEEPIVRERTDALDAVGNTTAAVGKGFASLSGALVGVALMGAFEFSAMQMDDDKTSLKNFELLNHLTLSGLFIGGMIPYVFSALTMKAVGTAALKMVMEVRRQFREHPGILEGTDKPEYARCIEISTQASLSQMILPGAIVIISPLLGGFLFGTKFLTGLLAGALVSGVQLGVSASNSGGAWDNAKKFIEAGNLDGCKGKGTDSHKAAVVGDTVGDPLKDTSGPSINIVMKLMAIISLVFVTAMKGAGPQKSNNREQFGGLVYRLFG